MEPSIIILICGIYLIGTVISIFVIVPWMVVNKHIDSYQMGDTIQKCFVWPFVLVFWLVALVLFVIILVCNKTIYKPLEWIFDQSVRYFTKRLDKNK